MSLTGNEVNAALASLGIDHEPAVDDGLSRKVYPVSLDCSIGYQPARFAFGDERADLSTPDDITVGVDLFRKHGGDIALRH